MDEIVSLMAIERVREHNQEKEEYPYMKCIHFCIGIIMFLGFMIIGSGVALSVIFSEEEEQDEPYPPLTI